MVESVNSVVLLWGVDLQIVYINPYGAHLFGFDRAELTGRSVLGTIVPDGESTGRDLRDLMWEIVQDPDRFSRNDNENVTKDGRRIWLSWSNRGVTAPDGRRFVLSVGNDITALRDAQQRLVEQAQQTASLEERQHLARELHDSVSQALYGIAVGARAASRRLETNPAGVAEALDYVLSLAEAGLTEMRALIFELRPESLEREGLVAALGRQAAAARARFGLEVEADLCPEPELTPACREALYRISQEALNNVAKHAVASAAAMRLACEGSEVVYSLGDDGKGFDASGQFPGHLGLSSMRERAAGVGGSLTIESRPGAGTLVVARIPAAPVPDAAARVDAPPGA
jgi:PAS domain S-box-containing protein